MTTLAAPNLSPARSSSLPIAADRRFELKRDGVMVLMDRYQAKDYGQSLSRLRDEADNNALHRRVRLGVYLIEMRSQLRHGEYGDWLKTIGLHIRVAQESVRHAVRLADSFGELDTQRLFELLHKAEPERYPSIETFEADRVSLREVKRATKAAISPPESDQMRARDSHLEGEGWNAEGAEGAEGAGVAEEDEEEGLGEDWGGDTHEDGGVAEVMDDEGVAGEKAVGAGGLISVRMSAPSHTASSLSVTSATSAFKSPAGRRPDVVGQAMMDSLYDSARSLVGRLAAAIEGRVFSEAEVSHLVGVLERLRLPAAT